MKARSRETNDRPGASARDRPGASARDRPGASARVEARLWERLRQVEDPEIPVSVVGLGLIISLEYDPGAHAVDLKLTFTAMGCPATEFIEDDIRTALLEDPDVDEVDIEVVWDPAWTKDRIRAEAKERMRELGIAV